MSNYDHLKFCYAENSRSVRYWTTWSRQARRCGSEGTLGGPEGRRRHGGGAGGPEDDQGEAQRAKTPSLGSST